MKMLRTMTLAVVAVYLSMTAGTVRADFPVAAGVRATPAKITNFGATLYNAELSQYYVSTTLITISTAAFLDNVIVMPYTLMGIDPTKVVQVIVNAANGSGTNFDLIGWSVSLNGHGAAIAAFTGRDRISGNASGLGTLSSVDYPWIDNRDNLKWGTFYVSSGDDLSSAAVGINVLRVRVRARRQ